MKGKLQNLKMFNWRLWIALCLSALIPAIYQTIKTFLLSSGTQVGVFDIIGQMEWFDLINESLQAFLIVPLYSVLNRIFGQNKNAFAQSVFKTGVLSFVLYTAFSVGVFVYGSVLIKAMNPDVMDISAVSRYLQLETIAFMIGIFVNFANVVFVVIGKDKNVYVFLALRTVMCLIADLFLIPKFGVYGAAVSNITVNTILLFAAVWILYVQKYIQFSRFQRSDLSVFEDWCKTGFFSGLQQFTDNIVYAIMICKMVNLIAEQGNYWIANNFIWGWLLIPITALSEVIRSDCKNGYTQLKQFNYYFISGAVILLWAVSIPLWEPFYRNVENLPNAGELFSITIKLVPFYIAYAGCSIIDNIFIGLGKTGYNAVNSMIINFVYYGTFYILYLTKTIDFSMNTIILMFGFGMVFHFLVSFIQEKIFRKRNIKMYKIKA